MPPVFLHRRRLLAGLMASLFVSALVAPLSASAKSGLPLVLAQDAPLDVDPTGHLVSEKYDGVRAFWDGQRLRFRSGLTVAAPAWFLAALPSTPLDGELWLGRGQFDALSATVRRHVPDDDEWRRVRYMVFELPDAAGSFAKRAQQLQSLVQQHAWPALVAAPQQAVADRAALQRKLNEVVQGGGEGLVLHQADAPYVTGRSALVLKLKPLLDAEAVVIGHQAGRGKHMGRLGALKVRTSDGTVFYIGTGFSDAQREQPPPIGSEVTFSYRGMTPGGVPRFASFLRQRSV
jgi:DNA ligase 1